MADGVSYEGFYEGNESSFNPDYGNFIGYRMSAAQLGFPGSPQTANQLGETVNALKQGVKAFEVTLLQPDMMETIPKQHFQEMKAMMKLTGVKPSVHGPVIDAAGFTDKGWGGEVGRVDNERRMFTAIEKAHLLDSSGNIPIVFHSSNGAPGAEWKPGDKDLGEDRFVKQKGAVINRETGQIQEVKREYKFRTRFDPEKSYKQTDEGTVEIKGGPKGLLFDVESSVNAVNRGEWENRLTEIAQMNKHAEELIGAAPLKLEGYENAVETREGYRDLNTGKILPDFDSGDKAGQTASFNQMQKAGLFLENAELSFQGAFHQAYKYGTPEQKKKLKGMAEKYTEGMDKAGHKVFNSVERHHLLDGAIKQMQDITYHDLPQVYQESEAFAMDKASKTFGNLAMKSYDKFGDKAPVIAIENMFQGFAFSNAKDLKKLVKTSRKNFVDQLVKKEGLNRDVAKRIAEDKLGVTWDVGHLNVLKKTGFTDKDIVAQTKLISKDKTMVKHVHLTDNFGFADTHLAPGMGNVPIKKILEQLEKTGRLDEMRKITEAGAFVQHFKTSPHPLTMAAFGSPIYGMTAGAGWNQALQVQGSYFGGYGTTNPPQHHTMYGAGFTDMPVELGGQMPGGQSRFGNTPMS